MAAVLIYTDTQRINDEKAYLTAIIPFMQSAYDAIIDLELTASLGDLESLFNSISPNPQGTNYLELLANAFIKNKLIAKAGSQSYNGVTLSAQKVADMIEVPSVGSLVTPMNNYFGFRKAGFNIRFNLLDLADDVISKKGTADASLTTEYTYYSKTPHGDALAAQLFTMCTAMNALDAIDQQALQPKSGWSRTDGVVRGVEYWNNAWRPNLSFIRQQEALYGNA